MSVELDPGHVRSTIARAVAREMRVANLTRQDISFHLAEIITEALWETAVITTTDGPERGIIAGKRMIERWTK